MQDVLTEIFIPFFGTALGAACVFFVKGGLNRRFELLLSGFAAGVMVAASVWSLLIPAMEGSSDQGFLKALPAVGGLWIGFLFLLFLDKVVRQLTDNAARAGEGEAAGRHRRRMLVLAVTLHNLPEGMAVGAVLAGLLAGEEGITAVGAFTLALGIAIQNLPEGAIISLPLASGGMGKGKSFFLGVMSGAVEPVGAVLTLLAASLVLPLLPYFLSFAAGAMLYVVVSELIPAMGEEKNSSFGTLSFAFGFSFMMLLDVLLG